MTAVSIPESQADEALLRRFVARREADAFAELARRHAALVFGTCLRVTGDRHDAEELAQECFLRLATRGATVRSSVAGWLHATATRLACNAVRARGRRHAHESRAARSPSDAFDDHPSWRDIESILDEAVDSLPDELREAIVLHFLRSLPQSEVAARLDVHQSTASRRIAEGLRRLQERLTASGVSFAAIPLADVLVAAAAPAEVPDLSAGLARAALTGAVGGVFGGAGAVWSKMKAVIAMASAGLPAAVIEGIAGIGPGAVAAVAWIAVLAWLRPRWLDDLFPAADGRSRYDQPFYPFRRWAWQAMPAGWRRQMVLGGVMAAMFWTQAWALSRPRVGGGGVPVVGAFVVYGLLALSTSLRIAWKLLFLPKGGVEEASPESTHPGLDSLFQAFGLAMASLLAIPCFGVVLLRGAEDPGVIAALLIPMIVGSIGAWIDFVVRVRRARRLGPRPAAVAIAPGRGARSHCVLLAVILGFAAMLSAGPLAAEMIGRGNPQYASSPQGVRHLDGAKGMQPALGLLALAMTIRPLSLARRSIPRAAWLAAVALAILLGMIDAAACCVYLAGIATG